MDNNLKKEKREWFYLMKPKEFAISGCDCGNEDVEWSEFTKHLWCSKCEKDFIPESGGIFDGPIMINTAQMMGISFSRFNLKTEKIEVLGSSTSCLDYLECQDIADVILNKKLKVKEPGNEEIHIANIIDYKTLTLEENSFNNKTINLEFAITSPQIKKFNLIAIAKGNVLNIQDSPERKEFYKLVLEQEIKIEKSLKNKKDIIKKKI